MPPAGISHAWVTRIAMNMTMLRQIARARRGLLVTVLRTEGHTYKKRGERALYEVGGSFPLCGNIGTGCLDREILRQGAEAFAAGRPRIVRVDMSTPEDVVFGYGTYCGGALDLLLEPLPKERRRVYEAVARRLEAASEPGGDEAPLFLSHDLETGELHLTGERPEPADGVFVEAFEAPPRLYLFGATPLARQIVHCLGEMAIALHVVDWRPAFLETLEGIDHVRRHASLGELAERDMVLLLSHHFERDRDALREALRAGCGYVGMLSSTGRRDRIYDELIRAGVSAERLGRVSSPAGMDIGSRSDPEIAVSIVAEIVRYRNGPGISGRGADRGPDRTAAGAA